MFAELLSARGGWRWEQNSHAPLKNADKLVEGQGQLSPGLVSNVVIPLVTGFRLRLLES